MHLVLSDHAEKRRRQRGLTTLEIIAIIERPAAKRLHRDGRIEVMGSAKIERLPSFTNRRKDI